MNQRDSFVLVVDDHPVNLAVYRVSLEQIPGVHVFEAGSGRAALRILEGRKVDLVLLDIMMPGMDGFEVAREIARIKKKTAPPIIFITALDDDGLAKMKGYEEGALDYLYKPVDTKVLQLKVLAVLKLQRQRAEVEDNLALLTHERREVDALLAAAKDVMTFRDFPVVARKIFDRCKTLTGARSGYVALLATDGGGDEVILLDAGGLPRTIPPQPMPIRGLQEVAYAGKRTVYDNAFMSSPYRAFLPVGHVAAENVLFAPLIINDKAVGLLGLADKPGGFDGNDQRAAGAFGELAALALLNARILDSLNRANRLMEQAGAMARLGAFEWNMASGELFRTSGLFGLLGHAGKREASSVEDILACVHARDKGRVVAALDQLRAGKDMVEMEFLGCGAKDGHVFLFQARALAPLGQTDMVIGACQDISSIKEMEARAMHAQKLDALGQLAGGLAHEVNTPLQYLTGNLDFIGKAFETLRGALSSGDGARPTASLAAFFTDTGPKMEEAIQDCNDGLRRIQATITSMLRFSSSEFQGQAYVSLDTMINDVVALSRTAWEHVADLRLDLAADLPETLNIPGGISVCLLNLVLNAADAIRGKAYAPGEKGRITVGTRREGQWLHLWVEDTGSGIPESVRPKIFNPFFTTREVGKGTGLGLTLAHAAVHGIGGELRFDTEDGAGSTFHVRLPLGKE
ncbi:MAG: response regulator [Desulfovibrionaceae bacterium]